jgi:hypothetical protein
MEKQQVISILESLAHGNDPVTGLPIPIDAFHSADATRALFTASDLLRRTNGSGEVLDPASSGKKTLTAAGAPWSAEEDVRLGAEFDAGMTVAQIALQHGRSSGAITSRLVKLGRIDPATVKTRERGAKIAS